MVHGPQSSRGARGLASARLGNHLKCRSHARIASFARLPEGAAAVAYGGFERQASGIVARAWYFFPRSSGQADCVRAVDLAANKVGLSLDVLRRPDASPAAVLGVVVAKVKTEAAA